LFTYDLQFILIIIKKYICVHYSWHLDEQLTVVFMLLTLEKCVVVSHVTLETVPRLANIECPTPSQLYASRKLRGVTLFHLGKTQRCSVHGYDGSFGLSCALSLSLSAFASLLSSYTAPSRQFASEMIDNRKPLCGNCAEDYITARALLLLKVWHQSSLCWNTPVNQTIVGGVTLTSIWDQLDLRKRKLFNEIKNK